MHSYLRNDALVGQLKAISAPFYQRLNAAVPDWLAAQRTANGTNSSGSIFPWTTSTADDSNKAVATIGQLKAVFSLGFESLPAAPDTDLVDTEGTSGASHPEDLDQTGNTYTEEPEPVVPEVAEAAPAQPPPFSGVLFTYKLGDLTGANGQGLSSSYGYDTAGNIKTISP